MKARVTIESGKHLPGKPKPEHGMYVAWAELNGVPITGELAAHSNREVAEHDASEEFARRMRHLLRPEERPVEPEGSDSSPQSDG